LINGLPIVEAHRPEGGNTYFVLTCPELPEGTTQLELKPGARARVTGVIAADHGHFWDPAQLEFHPVYSIDLQQDFKFWRTSDADLTGVWHCDDVGTYYLRQVDDNRLWWLGLSRDQGRTFANVFHGTIDGDIIAGEWADIPIGIEGVLSNGSLVLKSDGSGNLATTLMAESNTGLFLGSTWRKLYDRPLEFRLGVFPR
jgi:hypothetical protein